MFYQNMCEPFLLNVRRYPWKTALVFGSERYTYAQLNRRVNKIAGGLKNLGVRPGDKVAFLFPNCCEIVMIYYAVQKLGAVAVPLNFRLQPREIAFLINASDSSTLIFSAEFARKVADAGHELKRQVRLVCSEKYDGAADLRAVEASVPEEEPTLLRDSSALSRIQFTGGTTGVPKGVMRTHEADLAELMGEMMYNKLGADADHVVLIQCPLEHHGGHSWFTAALSAGAALIICDAFNPEKILGYIQREKVTYMLLLPPTTYLRLCEFPGLKGYDVSSVRLVQSAAGCTTPEIVLRIGDAFPNAEIFYGWGQTESGLGTSLILTREMAKERLPLIGSIGRPMPFVEMKVVDDEWNELPPGQIGEGVIRTPAAMSGYYAQPELTASALRGDGWLRTGDMMRMDDKGYFYLLSRKKDMIKSGGENVFAQEVEQVIREHSSVAECVVTGVEDEVYGEAVLAVVQLRPGRTLSLEELQEHCRKYISSYKKPRYLEFIDHFDMDDAGKIRKREICEKYRTEHRNQTKQEKPAPQE